MSASSDPTGTRLVPIWTEPKTANHLERIAYDVDDELDKALLLQIAEQIYAAPAGPVEAVEAEVAGGLLLNEGSSETTRAVLAALGCVVERPANTGDHHA